jgi:hypothetical protein
VDSPSQCLKRVNQLTAETIKGSMVALNSERRRVATGERFPFGIAGQATPTPSAILATRSSVITYSGKASV